MGFFPFSDTVSTFTSGAISRMILSENPRARSSLCPWLLALYPTPTSSNCLVQPSDTPFTILDIREWYRPCMALCSLESEGLATCTLPVSTLTSTPENSCESSPSFPLTVNMESFTSTVTPSGIEIGLLPILDIFLLFVQLIYVAQHLSPDILLLGLFAGHHSMGSGDYRNAQTVEDPGKFL